MAELCSLRMDFSMAKGVVPECRYGHGPLSEDVIEKRPLDPDATRYGYAVPTVVANLGGLNFDLGRAYVFEVWECKVCSYIELHNCPLGHGP